MIAIVIHWERAAWALRKDALRKIQKWHTFAMKPFGVTRLLIVDLDGNNPLWSDAEMQVTNHDTLEDALKQLPGYTPVYVEAGLENSINLESYIHPTVDTVYIFGSDYSTGKMDPGDADVIEIEQPTGLHIMWVPIPIGIVLHDRYVKSL